MPTQTLYQQEAVEGAVLFRTVCKYELTQQHRSLDETHTRWLQYLRDPAHTKPITDEMLDAYGVLNSTDIATDKLVLQELTESQNRVQALGEGTNARAEAEEAFELEKLLAREKLWTMAPIAVAGNAQHHLVNKHKLISYAEQTCQPLLCWHNKLRGELGETLMEEGHAQALDAVREEYPELVSYFAVGAPAYLNCNVNPRKKLANGTSLNLHSLRFESDEDNAVCVELIEAWKKFSQMEKKKPIWVPVPEAINVEVPGIYATDVNANQRVKVAKCLYKHPETGPELKECIVIPIPLQHRLSTAGKKRYFTVELTSATKAKMTPGAN